MKNNSNNAENTKLLSADELFGFFNKVKDKGNYILDLKSSRTERIKYVSEKLQCLD